MIKFLLIQKRKMVLNIFKYEVLKKHVGTYIELPEKLQKKIFHKY